MPTRPVSEVIGKRTFPTVEPSEPINHVARIMREAHSSAILVVEDGRLCGICTERDIVFGAVADDRDLSTTSVRSVMTRNVQTITPEKPFGHALHMMYEGGFRHLAVVDERGRPIGLLAAHDALDLDGLQLEHDLERRQDITAIL